MAEQIGKNRARFRIQDLKWLVEKAIVDSSLWTEFGGVVTDSRQVEPGNIFVAIKGEKFDGHDFLPELAKIPGIWAVVSDE